MLWKRGIYHRGRGGFTGVTGEGIFFALRIDVGILRLHEVIGFAGDLVSLKMTVAEDRRIENGV